MPFAQDYIISHKCFLLAIIWVTSFLWLRVTVLLTSHLLPSSLWQTIHVQQLAATLNPVWRKPPAGPDSRGDTKRPKWSLLSSKSPFSYDHRLLITQGAHHNTQRQRCLTLLFYRFTPLKHTFATCGWDQYTNADMGLVFGLPHATKWNTCPLFFCLPFLLPWLFCLSGPPRCW